MEIVVSDIALDDRGDFKISPVEGLEIVTGTSLLVQYLKMALRSEPGDIKSAPGFGVSLKSYASLPNTREVAEILQADLTEDIENLPGAEGYTVVPTIYPTGARSISIELGIFTPEGERLTFDVNVEYDNGTIIGFGTPDIRPDDPYTYSQRVVSEIFIPEDVTNSYRTAYSPQVHDQIYAFKTSELSALGYSDGTIIDPDVIINNTLTGLTSQIVDMSTYLSESILDPDIGNYRINSVYDITNSEYVDFVYSAETKQLLLAEVISDIEITVAYEAIYARGTNVETTQIEPTPYVIRPYMRDYLKNEITFGKSFEAGEKYLIQYTTSYTR